MKITYNNTRMKQQNVYYCRLHFLASSASEVSLTLVPVGAGLVISSDKSFGHATGGSRSKFWIRRRIHSVPLATRQLVKAETVDSLLSSQI